MEDVARRARVSMITVSRVLRSPSVVAKRTRERVARAIAEMGYVRNRVAGTLASSRSNVIAAVIPSISHSALESMVQGLTDAAGEHGLHIILATSGDSPAGEEDAIEALLAQRPCGLCLHNTTHTPRARALLKGAGIPIVETGDLLARPIDAAVGFSNFAAAKEMTLYLAGKGYRHIGYAGRPLASSERAKQRLNGYLAGLEALGRKADPSLILEISGWMEAASAATAALLAREPRVDAIFFSAGIMAIGGLMECQRRGWAVPGRLAIAGFDDNELAASTTPALTTVRVPRYDIGRRAAEVLVERLEGRTAGSSRTDVGFEIVARASA
jgi:LacI family gluconate utilization system Gnt-I transcriptional repressor